MHTVWRADPTLRLRPVPELASCLAYKKGPRRLYGLNLTSWLVLTLCDGRDRTAMEQAFAEATDGAGGAGASPGALDLALSQLETLGLIRRTPQGTHDD